MISSQRALDAAAFSLLLLAGALLASRGGAGSGNPGRPPDGDGRLRLGRRRTAALSGRHLRRHRAAARHRQRPLPARPELGLRRPGSLGHGGLRRRVHARPVDARARGPAAGRSGRRRPRSPLPPRPSRTPVARPAPPTGRTRELRIEDVVEQVETALEERKPTERIETWSVYEPGTGYLDRADQARRARDQRLRHGALPEPERRGPGLHRPSRQRAHGRPPQRHLLPPHHGLPQGLDGRSQAGLHASSSGRSPRPTRTPSSATSATSSARSSASTSASPATPARDRCSARTPTGWRTTG